jgi:ABC-2 type transport system permease protein
MMGLAFYLARKDLGHMLRARETWLWAFLMPVVFFYAIGAAAGGFARPAGRDTLALLAPADAGWLAERLERRLERDFRVVRVPDAAGLARRRRGLILPAGFTEQVLAGKPVEVRLRVQEKDLGSDYDRFRAGRAVYTLLADLIVVSQHGRAANREAVAELERKPRSLTVAVESAGRRPPRGFEQAVPGIMVMFLLLTMLSSGGVWLVIERKQGILRRLAAAPVSRGAIVAGKCGGRWALGMIQTGFAMAAGSLLFKVGWGSNWPAVVALLAVYAGLTAMLGVLLGSLARSERQVIGLAVTSANVLGALGGCWWPIEITPFWAQRLALALPTGWAMDGLHKLVSFGEPIWAVTPHLAVLGLATALAGWGAARAFRFQ